MGTSLVPIRMFASLGECVHRGRVELQASESYDLSDLHFLFFSLMAVRSSVGLVSKISVLDVLSNRQEVIVFDKQSDSVADVSTRREL